MCAANGSSLSLHQLLCGSAERAVFLLVARGGLGGLLIRGTYPPPSAHLPSPPPCFCRSTCPIPPKHSVSLSVCVCLPQERLIAPQFLCRYLYPILVVANLRLGWRRRLATTRTCASAQANATNTLMEWWRYGSVDCGFDCGNPQTGYSELAAVPALYHAGDAEVWGGGARERREWEEGGRWGGEG